jgi:hypothetical protein
MMSPPPGAAMRARSGPHDVAGPLSQPTGSNRPSERSVPDGSRSKGFWERRRAPKSCSVNPHMIPARGAPVPQSRAVHPPASTAAVSGASDVLRDFRPAALPTATTRDRGHLTLIATIRQEVIGVSGDPEVGQQRLQVYLVRRQGHQQRTLTGSSTRCRRPFASARRCDRPKQLSASQTGSSPVISAKPVSIPYAIGAVQGRVPKDAVVGREDFRDGDASVHCPLGPVRRIWMRRAATSASSSRRTK